MNKYIDLYLKIFDRYKIIVYALIATLILLEHKFIAYTFYALSFYELTLVLIAFYKDHRIFNLEKKETEIKYIKVRLEEKKLELSTTNKKGKK